VLLRREFARPTLSVQKDRSSLGGLSFYMAKTKTPKAIKSVPEVTEPVVPEVTEPVVPEVTEPVVPEVTEPVVPEVTEPVVPEVTVTLEVDGKVFVGTGEDIETAIKAIKYPVGFRTRGVFTAKVGDRKSSTFLFPPVLRKFRCNKTLQAITSKRLTSALKK
jgi:hypothetical protein